MAGALQVQVPGRVMLAAVGLTAVLLATVVAGDVRERAQLPLAVEELRKAVVPAASLVNCFEGVQDDLFGGLSIGRTATPESRTLAATTLATCDLDAMVERIDALALPPPAPLTDAEHRRLRDELEEALDALDRTALDARTTYTAMAEALRAGADTAPEVTTGFRAVKAGYETAYARLIEAEARLERLRAPIGRHGGTLVRRDR